MVSAVGVQLLGVVSANRRSESIAAKLTIDPLDSLYEIQESWPAILMNIAAVGTAIAFTKFIFLPFT